MSRLAGRDNRGRGPQQRSRRGFTLMEVLVALVLVGILMMLLLWPIMNSLGYFRATTAKADAQSVARTALDQMTREISEAFYVEQDMRDNTMLAFVPPLRTNPNDPNSSIVTPPRPDWDHAVRYWRALHNPQINYSTGGTLSPPNPYFLARTLVDDPDNVTDTWNRWNQTLVAADAAPLRRVVHHDVDVPKTGDITSARRNKTLQPGYPYLYATWSFSATDPKLARFYRDHVVPVSPNSLDYDIPTLSFEPLLVNGEWLSPALGRSAADKSVYLARFPLWRLGSSYKSWTSLTTGEDAIFGATTPPSWAVDPFLVVYRWGGDSSTGFYTPIAVGCFNPNTRTMKILSYTSPTGTTVTPYDTFSYPYRPAGLSPDVAFGVNWLNGSVRFDYPPPQEDAAEEATRKLLMLADKPQVMPTTNLALVAARNAATIQTHWDLPLASWWKDYTVTSVLEHFLLPDSVTVRIDSKIGPNSDDGVDLPDRALTRVYRAPRDYSDEYQLGLQPGEDGSDGSGSPKYGSLRLPLHFADGAAVSGRNLWVYYRWRNNGRLLADATDLSQEKPDLVAAYYRTASVIDIHVSVTRATPTARPGDRISQSVNMTRRVKLQNVIRELRNAN